ncbi:putative beta-D-xylosidase 7 [Micractinium conductrix]|uniref:Beta-D-xylosidase 7 n=1 Tax=Micractinium conductrix TaxID=554055 RepID=A0A2P6VDP7_9CHLO|nr:putative beta-D-xylosidase 7 [Micractinium conductrix]|eukprot:PSC72215.1 putative beta-D-xylosidase 7 [Micractinium conductrix]
MTTDQKVRQLGSDATTGAVPSLGVPSFIWQYECLHGMKNMGLGVMYPAPIAWAATFNHQLTSKAATEIGDEMRAFNNQEMRRGRPPAASHCFGPHVGIVRDPRWGRLLETYGEDPRLSADMAYAFVTGLQGGPANGTSPVKVAATCKHFVGNDMENWKGFTRYNFDAKLSADDMRDTFLPPFEACVKANSLAMMCSYNGVNGAPSCVNKPLLDGTLRRDMGFKGFVLTDCTALNRIGGPRPYGFAYTNSRQEASVLALKAGTDMACHNYYETLDPDAVAKADIDRAARRVLTARVRLGHFDPANRQPWSHLKPTEMGSPEHRQTARQILAQGIVLLKNTGGSLPLKVAELGKVAVFGPFADDEQSILGNYYSYPNHGLTTPLEALRAALPPRVKVTHDKRTMYAYSPQNAAADVERCKGADACILFMGTRIKKGTDDGHGIPVKARYEPMSEGENMDRTSLLLNSNQRKLLQAFIKGGIPAKTKIVVVLVHGGPLDVSELQASPRIGAMLTAWVPGEGAAAIADVLFGTVSPSGRLPVTWYRDAYSRLPMTDTRMRASAGYPGRTHRYYKGSATLYPFGYGLSYTTFSLSAPELVSTKGAGATAYVTITNTGGTAADTSVLLFLRYLGVAAGPVGPQAPEPRASIAASGCKRGGVRTDLLQALGAYQRSALLAPGKSQRLRFWLPLDGGSASAWAGFGDPAPPCGAYALRLSADQPVAATLVLLA